MDPLTMLSIGSSVAGFFGAQDRARKQEQAFLETVLAVSARDLKIQTLNQRLFQEAEVAAEKKLDITINALKKEGRATVVAGEAGVEGSSVDAVTSQYKTQELRDYTKINSNIDSIERQIELQRMGASAEAENRINSMPRGQQPNFLVHAIGAAASAYAVERSMTVPMPDPYQSIFGATSTIFNSGQAVYAVQDAPWGMADDE